MIIDVVINSCARPDLLSTSLKTFKKNVTTKKHKFRYILVEDYVDDKERRLTGFNWIERHRNLFDRIYILQKKAGFGYHWQEAVKMCTTPYHIHLEDDQEFILPVNVDPLIEILDSNQDIIEILLRRSLNQNRKENNPVQITINGVNLTEVYYMSDSIGVYNTKLVRKLIDSIGWDVQLHEAAVLTPATLKLGIRKTVLGYDDIHYKHAGHKPEYRHGGWVKNG